MNSNKLIGISRHILRGNRLNAAAALCMIMTVYLLVCLAFEMLTFMIPYDGFAVKMSLLLLQSLATAVLVNPLWVGFIRWMSDLSFDRDVRFGDIFFLYEGGLLLYLRLWLLRSVQQLLASVLFLLPYGTAVFIKGYVAPTDDLYVVLLAVQAFLFIGGVAAMIMFLFRYSLTDLLFAQGGYTAFEIIRLSFTCTKDQLYSFLSMTVKFLPILFLCVFFVPIFSVVPLCLMSWVIFSNRLVLEMKANRGAAQNEGTSVRID